MMKFLAILLIISIASLDASKKLKKLHTKLDVLIAISQGLITISNQTPYDFNLQLTFKNTTTQAPGSVENFSPTSIEKPENAGLVNSINAQTQSQPTVACSLVSSGPGFSRTFFGICNDGVGKCKICQTQSSGCCV